MIKRLLISRWTYWVLRVVGFALLGAYVVLSGDWRFSPLWALAFPGIAFFVAWLMVKLRLHDRFPKLNRYLIYPIDSQKPQAALSEDEWARGQLKYIDSGLPGSLILAAPSEDGLICVPVLMVGLGPISAALAGLVFGLLHLGRYSFFECLGKGTYYVLICMFVLPHGLLTVALGHLIMDILALLMIKYLRKQLPDTAPVSSSPQSSQPLI